MYTGGTVWLRSFAFVLALLVAATPVIRVVCEIDCDQPLAPSSPPCHDASVPHDGSTLRGVPHACDHDHTGPSPALLTGATGGNSVGTSVAAPLPRLVRALVPEVRAAADEAMLGPPGLSGRSTSSHNTVLRI